MWVNITANPHNKIFFIRIRNTPLNFLLDRPVIITGLSHSVVRELYEKNRRTVPEIFRGGTYPQTEKGATRCARV